MIVFLKLKLTFFSWLGHVANRGEEAEKHLWWAADSRYSQAPCRFNDGVAERLEYREACLAINGRLFLPLAFFSSAFFSVNALSSAFCVPSFLSEALGFSSGNTRAVTVTAVWFSILFFQFTLGTCALFLSFLRCVCFVVCCWFVGQVALRLGVGIWFLGLFRGVLTVFWVCLGFLLPPCAFCGPSILLWGRV